MQQCSLRKIQNRRLRKQDKCQGTTQHLSHSERSEQGIRSRPVQAAARPLPRCRRPERSVSGATKKKGLSRHRFLCVPSCPLWFRFWLFECYNNLVLQLLDTSSAREPGLDFMRAIAI